ncbi:MAG: TRAP transporter small permease [Puniceicoccaceae bacterium]
MSGEGPVGGGFRRFLVKPLEVLLIVAMAAMTLDVLWGVFSRFILGSQTRWTEELAIYLLIWISLLGASLTYGERGHLGVDYFVQKLEKKAQFLASIVVELMVLLFSVFGLLYGGWMLVSKTLAAGQVSPTLGWPMGFIYLAAPVSGLFFTLFAVEHLVRLMKQGAVESENDNPIEDV